jgi:hypothetical protein
MACPRGHERRMARKTVAAVATSTARRPLRSSGWPRRNSPSGQGRQRAVPGLQPDGSSSARRAGNQPQDRQRALSRISRGARRAGAGRVLASAAARPDNTRPPSRPRNVAGRPGCPVRTPVRTMGHEVPGMRGVYSHITSHMRAELRDGLQGLWNASIHERALLAQRSAVAVLDGILTAQRRCL